MSATETPIGMPPCLYATEVGPPAPPSEPGQPTTATIIAEECRAIEAMLLAKNAAYGDSAVNPVRIFSHADPEEQIRVRIDDKLSRLSRGAAAGEDTELDLIGYLILLRVARRVRGRP